MTNADKNNEFAWRKLKALAEYLDMQANDEGLWFDARYVTEAYLQQELRRIVHLIEDGTVDEIMKEIEVYKERMP